MCLKGLERATRVPILTSSLTTQKAKGADQEEGVHVILSSSRGKKQDNKVLYFISTKNKKKENRAKKDALLSLLLLLLHVCFVFGISFFLLTSYLLPSSPFLECFLSSSFK